ncbi:MAG: GAF and HD-GYP domain-containing protein [Gammaproteobacteria bacterium]
MTSHAAQDLALHRELLDVALCLFAERDIHRLCDTIVAQAQRLTRAEGGTLYLVERRVADRRQRPRLLRFAIVRNERLGIRMGHDGAVQMPFAPLPLLDAKNEENHRHVACHAALIKKVVNVPDVYSAARFDFSGTREFDAKHRVRSVSLLAVPLVNAANETVGVLQLINARNEQGELAPFSADAEGVASFLARFAAVALDQQRLAEDQRELLVTLSGEPTTERLLERVLDEAQRLARAEGGTLYLMDESDPLRPALRFALLRNDVLGFKQGGVDGEPITLPPLPLLDEQGNENHRLVATYVANTRRMINIADVYSDADEFDFSGTQKFDQRNGYRSQSMLTIPLLNHAGEVIGVLQLINARDVDAGRVVPFGDHVVPVINALAAYAAIALNNKILVQDLKNLLDAFIKTIARAIDAKSPHTSAHCQRVPLLTELIAKAACADQRQFREFNLDDDGWYELRVASWLHDCGKLSTPDSVLDKSTKLHGLRDGIEAVNTRFTVARREIELDACRRSAADPAQAEALQAACDAAIAALEDDRQFIVKSNRGGEFMSQESKDRVLAIAQRQWADAEGNVRPMLTDEEVYNLCIERGTLTQEEREKINDHMRVTIDMLEGLPFPKKLRRVPEYAGGHHEKMDGSGFPKGLHREQMSLPARMMAIADIFEALTASDRPYKAPMKISQALSIMKRMREDRHIDPDLYLLFVESRVWEQYAKAAPLKPEQLDVEDVAPYR